MTNEDLIVKEESKEAKKKVRKFKALVFGSMVVADDKANARTLYEQSVYGEPKECKMQYSFVEAMYLLERGKLDIYAEKKKLKKDDFLKFALRQDKDFWVKFVVYRDMRNRGYIVKTALKFGADFRVYDRGVKPGEDHAKWILYPVHEKYKMSMYEFAAKNRVAHSTRKRLLLAVVDDENDVSYWNIAWTKP